MNNSLDLPSCDKKNNKLYILLYLIGILFFIIIGSSYETNKIQKNKFEKESVWWHGIIIIVVALVLFVVMFRVQKYIKGYDIFKMYFWSFSHILLYFILTYVSPGQWAFWMALGILWELIECHTLCWSKFGIPARCSGYYDIAMNFIGISSAIWIKYHINTGY